MSVSTADTVAIARSEDRETDIVGLIAAAVLGAALSLAVTGYVFGVGDTLYYLPIIGRLYDEPAFQNDAFVQSLRHFAAGPLLLLQGADGLIAPAWLLLFLDYASRLLTFIGFLACARLLGVSSRRDRTVFVILLAFASFMQGLSWAGGQDLFNETFSHSDLAGSLILGAMYFAVRGRLVEAFAINGLIFFCNAFVAVWSAGPFLCIIALMLWQRRITLSQVMWRGGLGFLTFLVLASPILANVLSNPDFGRPVDFDYRAFLIEYWPFHFLSEWNWTREKLSLLAVVLTGSLAFFALARRGDVFQAALFGYVGVYLIGVVAPHVTSSVVMFDLHLLRAGGPIHMISTLGGLALATTWLGSREPAESRAFAPLLIIALCTFTAGRFLAPVVILASRALKLRRLTGTPLLRIALVALLAVYSARSVRTTMATNAGLRDRVAQWTEVGDWARANTPADAVFLLPTINGRDAGLMLGNTLEPDDIQQGADVFEYASHRRVWVTFKRGAAVMWTQSYYPLWHARIADVLRLATLDQKLDYAARNGIAYVVAACSWNDGKPVLFRTRLLCVFRAPDASPPKDPLQKG